MFKGRKNDDVCVILDVKLNIPAEFIKNVDQNLIFAQLLSDGDTQLQTKECL